MESLCAAVFDQGWARHLVGSQKDRGSPIFVSIVGRHLRVQNLSD